MLYLQWMGMAAKIQQRNEVVNRQTADVYCRIVADGGKACVLKGQAINALYGSQKGLRQSGDIDIWMLDEPLKVIEWARKTGKMHYYDYHHADICIFNDNEVELHYRPSISRNLVRNARLQKWFMNEGVKHVIAEANVNDRQLSATSDVNSFAVPDYTFNVVLTLNHNFWHLMYEGVGLRQMMDLYFVLRQGSEVSLVSKGFKSAEDSKAETLKLLKHLKLQKFASASMWVMKEVLRLEDEFLLCKPDEVRGKALLDEIMQAGNFVHHDERLYSKNMKSSRISLMWRWIKHCIPSLNFIL